MKDGEDINELEGEDTNHGIKVEKLGVNFVEDQKMKEEEADPHKVVGVVPSIHLHDWFDAVFIQRRIEILRLKNKIESEDGSLQPSEVSFLRE